MSIKTKEKYDFEFKDTWTRCEEILQKLKSKKTDEQKIRELMYHIASAEMRGLCDNREIFKEQYSKEVE